MPEAPTEYYTSRYSGEEIDNGIDRAKVGGEIDVILSNKVSKGLTQEYNIPLSSGVSVLYKCLYREDQLGNIVVKLAARITGASKGFINVATLPEGYRPKFDTAVPATVKSVATGAYTESSAKIAQGTISVEFPGTGDFEFYANCVL